MSESLLDRLSFSDDDNDHSPSKKIKLDSLPEPTPELINPVSCDNLVPKSEDDFFDPVQAILDAGKRYKEEERMRNVVASLDEQSTKAKTQDMKESDAVSVDESDEDEESDENNDEPKQLSSSGVRKTRGKSGKKKASHMRRNIKDILKPEQLDDLTIAARKEEEERRQRMNLKLQQLHQQQLKLLQHQQSQLLRESLNAGVNNRSSSSILSRTVDELMRKKQITVSLDDNGIPQDLRTGSLAEDECILLSSDEETDRPSVNALPLASSFVPGPTPPQSEALDFKNKHLNLRTAEDEVIALSSGDEENTQRLNTEIHGSAMRSIDPRLYVNASSGGGMTSGRDIAVDSDDDCMIISPEPEGEDEVEEKDECSQDLINVPDHLGRVLVNVGHPDEDEDLYLPPQVARIVKPHQIGGIRFLYDNVVESKDRYNNTSGFGCILAHAMGLGKTLQTAAFCDVLLRTVGKTVLIIVPINTIQNWLNEFNRYLPSKENNWSSSGTCTKKRSLKTKFRKGDDDKSESNSSFSNEGAKLESETTGSNPFLTFNTSLSLERDSSNCCNATVSNEALPSHMHSISEQTSLQESEEASLLTEPIDSDISFRNFEVFLLNETVKSLQAREKIITTWQSNGGVLLMGYEMYRMLALKKLKKSSRKAMTLIHEERVAEAESLDKIYDCLVDPGPDCVICDEGHRIKNSGAGISQALKAIKTKRRVVLTGYPLQNNLMEYWCMVDFVRPNYLGTKAEFSNMFERPIQNGQCADSTYEDKRLMKYRSHVLHSLLEGFVQRRSHLVLRNALPHKEEWVFLVKLTPVQLRIYREFIRYLREDLESDNASTNPIKAFAVCCKIWNHPDVLWNVVKKNLDLELDLDIDEVRTVTRPKPKGTGRPRGRPPLNGISLSAQAGTDQFEEPTFNESSFGKSESSGISLEWAKPLFENYTPQVMENGVKFELLFQLIEESIAVGDKLLVFSQSLLTLDLIEVFLKKRLDWKKSKDYVRLDGSTAGLEREKLINEFNSSTAQKLFIISTRAGSLGINLVGANRVCIFDASWNPCHDSQAVCRIYRYGQTKPCHIYRFVSDCTLEKRIYDRQVNKKGMADRIVDEMNPNAPFKTKDVSSFLVLQHELVDKLPFIKCDINLEKFMDPAMKNVLLKMGDKITQEPFEHESLLIDQKHQRLSKSEKRLALKNYEKEKKTVANAYATYSRPSYTQYYSATNSMTPSYSSSPSISKYNYQRPSVPVTTARVSKVETFGGLGNASLDRFELHIAALKSRGISVFPVQLHQDTFLNDPSGAQDIFIRAGERVYILVSQKGTYLRVQGKLLRVPFVGTEMNQEQAERFVMSLLQLPSREDRGSSSRSHIYPVEQQLPPSNLLFQKNPNHLQITNSRNNSGGDIMMGTSDSSWNSGAQHQQPQFPRSAHSSSFIDDKYKSKSVTPNADASSRSQSDLQSLTRLAETFCQQPPSYSTDIYSPEDCAKPWSPISVHKRDPVVAPELEVIKLSNAQSSNSSSNSSSSRTDSPYRHTWSNPTEGNGTWANKDPTSCGKVDNPSFYTDFTIIPVSSSDPTGSQKQHIQTLEKPLRDNRQEPTANNFYNPVPSTDISHHAGYESLYNNFNIANKYGNTTASEALNSQSIGLDLSSRNNNSGVTEPSDRLALGLSDRNGGLLYGSHYNTFENINNSHF